EISFDVFQHGIIKRRVLEGYTKESDDWKIGHPILFPQILFVGGGPVRQMLQYRVPVDDERTLHVTFYAYRFAEGSTAPKQDRVPYKYAPVRDERGRFNVRYTIDQDKMAWVTQGVVAQRQFEKLGESDVGIILYRKLLRDQMEAVEDGGDPINVFRSEEGARAIDIPTESSALGQDQVKRLRFMLMEEGISGAEADATAAYDSWFPDEVPARS
ncbi:MAG: hypothetical protein V3S98_07345, partial [Dehalococcoidia bacterium]